MQFDLMTIEVDGSLSNPIVVITVLIWGVFLGLVTAVVVRLGMGAKLRGRRGPALARYLAVAGLYVASWPGEVILGNFLYKVDSALAGRPETVSVGFWGGPPVLPSWGIGLLGGLLTAVAGKRQRRGSAGSLAGNEAP